MILTKKKMKEIAGIYEKEICAKVPDHEDDNYEFSSEYDDKMRHMILGAEIKPIKKTAPTGKKAARVAAAAVAVMVMLGLNTEVRASVKGWFSHPKADDPKTVVYEFNEDYTDKKFPQITIGWLPEDFEGVEPEDKSDDEWFDRTYCSKSGRVVTVNVSYMHSGGRAYVIPEKDEKLHIEQITVNGNAAEYYSDSQTKGISVFDDSYGIMIQIDSNIEKDEIIKIAENILISDES